MKIKRATKEYTAWLAGHTRLVPADLARKYRYMAQGKDDGSIFFRATFYRWAQLWPELCPELALAPELLAVGDLHVDNFGTWCNAEEQLVWGINDLDEAAMLPYTADLVRLATSADIAIRAHKLDMASRDACDSILSGYAAGLKTGGQPFLLAEAANDWLRRLTTSDARQQKQWWRELCKSPAVQEPVPASALAVLQQLMPELDLPQRIVRRQAGVGSLGRQRWTAIASWQEQQVVREVKALVPSAWLWATQQAVTAPLVDALLSRAVRSPDPYVRVEQGWITRRLAPDSRRIELDMLHSKRVERLLYAMGQETANLHLGSPAAIQAVQLDFARQPAGWLYAAAQTMTEALTDDWKEWRRDPIRSA